MDVDFGVSNSAINELALQMVFLTGFIVGAAIIARLLLSFIPLPSKVKDFLMTAAMLIGAVAWTRITFY
ncbi:hypothetical protein [Halobacillus sp. A5]|uniref:hypothetical protein n=1 Tax=Halobacillus sp. A5 TaxID=2880263 RepID=UPI0020A63767|nr:hypothetical protein [Halobacillus sp. A5]MCP3026621.1 hypothetical protein [Halobacillus sp. A5]